MTPERFIERWNGKDGSERANYQSFFNELCELLGVEKPEPARADTRDNAYVHERHIKSQDGRSASDNRYIDTYKRGCFIAEGKAFYEGKPTESDNSKLQKARAQAEAYARSLPEHDTPPPLLMVINVGRFIALYAQFKDKSRAYEMFPDKAGYLIRIDDLADDAIRARLRQLWLDPHALDPELTAAQVTRAVAEPLSDLARSLSDEGHAAPTIAGFLTRCLFSMFAEDVGLLPAGAFTHLLDAAIAEPEERPACFVGDIGELWQKMDSGGYSVALRKQIPHFNGKLFKQPDVIALHRSQIEILRNAARQDWKHVEPAIFGTLMERSLNTDERHALGAEYTPRAYVERLVLPTLIDPLRQEWEDIRATAIKAWERGQHNKALKTLRQFQLRLCSLRVLDPACGSGNFLYIALEHLKRLEAEILEQLEAMNVTQSFESEGLTVDPHQFLGIELNPRAAAIAELVLWIGYLQWHFKTRGQTLPATPILRDFKNIECRDAVLKYKGCETVLDEDGQPVRAWDGKTFKPHPVTGKDVPDESATVEQVRYLEPQAATWPKADIVVGNPPFIGASAMRRALGDGYVDALRATHPGVPDSADLVMFWWQHAAQLLASGAIGRFGFITTNSITQTFNRRVLEQHIGEKLHLAFAIPDHPWVDNADGAAVRVAMTVAEAGTGSGRLLTVVSETPNPKEGTVDVELVEKTGHIHADLTVGPNVAGVVALEANSDISNRGFCLFGAGFIVTPEEAAGLDAGAPIKDYRNGRDLTDRPRSIKVIDLFGLSADEVRGQYPATYQWVFEHVKPERDNNKRESRRKNWWLFGEPNPKLRLQLAGLPRYIATVETAKHRVFQFLDASIAPDNKLICIAIDDAYSLGVLSSQVHISWVLAAGSTLEDRPVYVKTTCFETFPFPAATPEQQAAIGKLAGELDAHRKRVLAEHAELTLTGLYNVLAKLRAGTALTAKEQTIHQKGQVALLQSLHDELDAAVLDAYGWTDAPDTDTLLERLVALNAERAKEEADGTIRWLRPAFQNPEKKPKAEVTSVLDWPAKDPQRFSALVALIEASASLQSVDELSSVFPGALREDVERILETLAEIGRIKALEDGTFCALKSECADQHGDGMADR